MVEEEEEKEKLVRAIRREYRGGKVRKVVGGKETLLCKNGGYSRSRLRHRHILPPAPSRRYCRGRRRQRHCQ